MKWYLEYEFYKQSIYLYSDQINKFFCVHKGVKNEKS